MRALCMDNLIEQNAPKGIDIAKRVYTKALEFSFTPPSAQPASFHWDIDQVAHYAHP